MYSKITLILIFIMVVTVSGCSNPQDVPLEDNINNQQQNQSNILRKDRLSKSNEENVEENINGYNIIEDQMITQISEEKEENNILYLNQNLKTQILDGIGPLRTNTILAEYRSMLPNEIQEAVQYPYYNIAFDYFLVTKDNASQILENPIPNSPVVATVRNLDKVSLYQCVQGQWLEDSDIWYRVGFYDGNQLKEGYIHSSLGTPRSFRFDRMKDSIDDLREQLNQGGLYYISNYKNQNGAAPQEGSVAVDEYGYRYYHSAPAYIEPNTNSNYRYIPDGILVRIIGETNEFYLVNVPTFGSDYYVPKQFIDPNQTLNQLRHVIVIDRSQQNQAAFEVGENGLSLVSYTLSTTGVSGEYSYETTLGNYKAIQKRESFLYLQKGSQDIAGYAPFAIRFTGGAYIHGVPVAYENENGQQIDPGNIEYLHTIGTFPRSSMCVRNYTSHAEFLFNWMDITNGAVIVIE